MEHVLIGRICPRCGKEFYPGPQHIYKVRSNRGDTHYCSWTCFNHRDEVKKRLYIKRVTQLTLDGEPVREFNSVNQAAEWVGSTKTLIRRACNTKTAFKGYLWRYSEDV